MDGRRFPAPPAFDAPATGADGVAGTLRLGEGDQDILAAELMPRSVYTEEHQRLRREAAHRALVIVCTGTRLLNAEGFRNPYGAPAIHLRC